LHPHWLRPPSIGEVTIFSCSNNGEKNMIYFLAENTP
jgi:hypothetical protein